LVKPSASTTYTIIARGPGGANEASTRITVNSATIAKASSLSDEDLVRRNIKDVFFEYDRSAIGSTEVSSVQRDEEFLQQHPSIKVLIEGHCDDRGSEEYNIALGSSRAETLKQALEQKGIDSGRLKTVSYGKEKPFCAEDNEQCWHQNRVDHFAFER
jgi:peptidoglycan-associated lipoprotein